MSSNEIKIKITEEFEDNRKKANKLFKDIGDAGGFSGQHGQMRKSNIEASFAGINAILEKGNLSLTDLKELDKFFKSLYENLGKAAANTSQMSKELTALIDNQVKTLNKLNEKRQQQLDLLNEGKFDKNTKKFTSTKDSANVLRDIGAFKETKNGDPSKRAEVNLANIMKNMEAGIKYYDKDNNSLADNPAFQEQVNKLKELNLKNDNLSKAISRYEKALNEATAKIEAQTKLDEKTGNSSSLSSQVVTEQIAVSNKISNFEETVAQTKNIKDFNNELDINIPKLNQQTGALKKAFKQFSIYALFVNNARKALNSAVATVKDLDRYLTEQAMVTGKTRKEVFGLVKTYQSLAKQYNATSKEVAEVNTEFMRQGKSMEESIQLTEAALASARVAGISGAESVDYLTTALNGFQLAAEDAMRVSDKFAAVAAASATSYEEIAVALSKVASQANTAGMSIDYTTALLSKGIETTKEAPETIGTALKTVIARMRELGDYGETLSGDTDINNVETQLAYVGIELKNANGELRSTEDVLDELGRKWNTLSNNQQAAVAKALAGTRQQSRLIAMMSDYERVIELQTIAQRSQGSTLAQMSALMTGLDASLNKISIAWEGIISNIVDNDFIIALSDIFGFILEGVEAISDNSFGLVLTYGSLLTLGVGILANKMQERSVQKELNQLALEEQIQTNQAKIAEVENNIELEKQKKIQNEIRLSKLQELETTQKTLVAQKEKTVSAIKEALVEAQNAKDTKKVLALTADLVKAEADVIEAKADVDNTKYQITQLKSEIALSEQNIQLLEVQKKGFEKIGETLQQQMGKISQFAGGILNIKNTFINIKKLIPKIGDTISKVFSKLMANPIFLAIAVATVAVAGLIIGFSLWNKRTERATEKVSELSAEIYNLNEQSSAIKNITKQYDELDNKIIKTKADQEEMNKLLDEAAEKLDEDQQKEYKQLVSAKAKREYLDSIEQQNREEMQEKYDEQLKLIMKDPEKMMEKSTNKAAVVAMNNFSAGEYIDTLTELDAEDRLALEGFTQDLISELDDDTLLHFASKQGKKALEAFVNQIKDVSLEIDNESVSLYNILGSEDYSWTDQVEAYQKALGSLSGAALTTFKSMYEKQYEFLSTLGEKTLEYFDELALTGDEINQLYDSFNAIQNADATKNLKLSEAQYKSSITNVLQSMTEDGKTLGNAIEDVFVEQLSQFEKGSKEYNEAVDTFVKTIGKTMEIGSLNMGQNIEKFGNRISSVYEKATQWSSLSESEKTQFLNDNQDLFKGEQGAALAKAFENGNYEMIKNALMSSDILNKEYKKLQAEIDRELSYQMSLSEESRDHAYVQYLKDQKEFYAQKDKLFKISIEEEKKQQDAQLNVYKDYLKKQQDALTESLEKQKEAYEKYFDQINEVAEDEDYEEKAELLVSNISKLSGSNAATEAKRADLEKQLEELEKERLQELRERAQEQIISNIEDEIEAISDKFDKLLDSNQAMLLALTGDIQSPEEFTAKMISTEIASGANTALDIQSFLNSLQSNFGMLTSGYDFSKLDIREDENKNLILNVNGTTYNLTTAEEKNLFDIIMTALTQIGKF